MQYAGVVVRLRPEAFAEVVAGLGGIEGVEVHHRDRLGGRLVVVIETDDLAGQEQGLRRIRDLTGVVVAEPAYFYEPADADASGTPHAAGPGEEDGS